MAKLRRVRKGFRTEALQLISAGEGNFEKLMKLAEAHFADAGYHEVLRAFWAAEISNAVSFLRSDGQIETIGKKWKLVSTLTGEDVDVISMRRRKRLRGELKAEVELCHNHGRIEDATMASEMLGLIQKRLDFTEETETSEADVTEG